jgi:hypothetical protein
MTLQKVAKKVTPAYTFYAYLRVDSKKRRYYWLNPYNEKFIPLQSSLFKYWEKV